MASIKIKSITPEKHYVNPTKYVPNSRFPVLVYRNALPNFSPEASKAKIESNNWGYGGQWGTYKIPHFHIFAHECYYVLKGKTRYGLGKALLDNEFNEKGDRNETEITFEAGDVFVLPAGTSHCSIETCDDFEYVGFYSPQYPPQHQTEDDMHFGDLLDATPHLVVTAGQCALPNHDPLYGADGPLPKVWDEKATL